MKAIPGYEGYYSVTEDGKVFSHGSDKFIVCRRHPRGYLHTALYKHGAFKNHLVHRLVADTYLPKVFGKANVNHINFDKTDNRVENLEWCTQLENINHARANGHFGTRGGRKPKLQPGDDVRIKELYATGLISQSELARQFTVSQGLIWLIVSGKRTLKT